MTIKNEIVLITYADSMGKNLKELYDILKTHFKGIVGGIHILPFFPSSADRGFAPLTYKEVDEKFGSWKDIEDLGREFYLIYDFMINHISRSSEYFKDFVKNKDQSPYADMFIRYKNFWPDGKHSREEIELIYKRKPKAPYTIVKFEDGTTEKIWCTFDDEQLDLNVKAGVTKSFIRDSLVYLASKGASIIRLDAFAYTIKKAGTDCFFIEPAVWELLDYIQTILKTYGVEILPEIHEHYSNQMKLAKRDYWVYDFALPMLVLHTLYSGSKKRLVSWLKQCPRKQFTTLDTHDGIGVVDVHGLLSDKEIDQIKEYIFSREVNGKELYNLTTYNNIDNYQINCTYYSALRNNDDAYLLARAIQFFTPGIPQVYYVGLLAGENDIKLLKATRVGRDINRHYYTREEIEENLQRPVLKKLFNLMKFRNTYPAFNGDFKVLEGDEDYLLIILWKKGSYEAKLQANLRTYRFSITYFDPETKKHIELTDI
ncbi:MAG: sucrose phosphorylase [Actinobacteria bacterium]|nr:sucrose phosphorylase [Actinomycetota bacterium]